MGNISEETREKMRFAKLGKKRKPHSIETKIKMSIASKGKKKSDEHKKSISVSKLSNPTRYWLGRERPSMVGKNNPKWITDRSLVIGRHDRNFHNPEYKSWRKNICTRDNWKCCINNSECLGRLEVHHILSWKNYPEFRYEIDNGITLCHFHHPRKRVDEVKLSPFFKELINIKS